MSGSNRSRATARLYPRRTGGHGGSVLIVTLQKRREGKANEDRDLARVKLLVCALTVSIILVLAVKS